MKVILLKNVDKLASQDSVVDVAEGYARNFLLRRKLAMVATPETIRLAEAKKQAKMAEEKKKQEATAKIVGDLAKVVITLTKEAGLTGKLFGSVTSKEISDKIKETAKLEIEPEKIKLAEPIKSTGEYNISIELNPQTKSQIKLIVSKKA